jgi:hypothetical protein
VVSVWHIHLDGLWFHRWSFGANAGREDLTQKVFHWSFQASKFNPINLSYVWNHIKRHQQNSEM